MKHREARVAMTMPPPPPPRPKKTLGLPFAQYFVAQPADAVFRLNNSKNDFSDTDFFLILQPPTMIKKSHVKHAFDLLRALWTPLAIGHWPLGAGWVELGQGLTQGQGLLVLFQGRADCTQPPWTPAKHWPAGDNVMLVCVACTWVLLFLLGWHPRLSLMLTPPPPLWGWGPQPVPETSEGGVGVPGPMGRLGSLTLCPTGRPEEPKM